MIEVSEVNTDFLKVLLGPLLLAQHQPVGEADPEVAEPEEEEVPPYSLVNASFPQEQQPEKSPYFSSSVNMVHVSHSHPP